MDVFAEHDAVGSGPDLKTGKPPGLQGPSQRQKPVCLIIWQGRQLALRVPIIAEPLQGADDHQAIGVIRAGFKLVIIFRQPLKRGFGKQRETLCQILISPAKAEQCAQIIAR